MVFKVQDVLPKVLHTVDRVFVRFDACHLELTILAELEIYELVSYLHDDGQSIAEKLSVVLLTPFLKVDTSAVLKILQRDNGARR